MSSTTRPHIQDGLILAPHPDFVFGFPGPEKEGVDPILMVMPGKVHRVDDPVCFCMEDDQWYIREGRLFSAAEMALIEADSTHATHYRSFWRTREDDLETDGQVEAYYDLFYRQLLGVPASWAREDYEGDRIFSELEARMWRDAMEALAPATIRDLADLGAIVEMRRWHFWSWVNEINGFDERWSTPDAGHLIRKHRRVREWRGIAEAAGRRDEVSASWSSSVRMGTPSWFQGHQQCVVGDGPDGPVFVAQFWTDDLITTPSRLLYLFYDPGGRRTYQFHDLD